MKYLKLAAKIVAVTAIILIAAAALIFQLPTFGGTIEGARLERVKKSPEFVDGRFENDPPHAMELALFKTLKAYMQGQIREPQFEVPVLPIGPAELAIAPSSELSAVWLGHATVLLEIGGVRLLTDPVLSEFASPLAYVGPERLHPSPIALKDLSHIDAVVISHDHYDHLDMPTIQHLSTQGTQFYVPLGIGAHLERWDVPLEQIHEMEWWQSADLKGVTIFCTPARHYSGRKRMDNSTLWSSWLIKSPTHSAYFSGDTGYSTHFAEIKEKLGAVDLTLMKVGAYGSTWLDIHMDPESAIRAHLDLGAKILLPVHWATFNLAYHAWSEPILRTLRAADEKSVTVVTPRLGERFNFDQPFTNLRWYEAGHSDGLSH